MDVAFKFVVVPIIASRWDLRSFVFAPLQCWNVTERIFWMLSCKLAHPRVPFMWDQLALPQYRRMNAVGVSSRESCQHGVLAIGD